LEGDELLEPAALRRMVAAKESDAFVSPVGSPATRGRFLKRAVEGGRRQFLDL
jgi:hypothetical protein